VQIFPKDGKEDEIYNSIKPKLPSNAKIYRKIRITRQIQIRQASAHCAAAGFARRRRDCYDAKSYDQAKKDGNLDKTRGAHGYDNELESMRATFIAHGAAFKKARSSNRLKTSHLQFEGRNF
jgi:hypothetical protein